MSNYDLRKDERPVRKNCISYLIRVDGGANGPVWKDASETIDDVIENRDENPLKYIQQKYEGP